VTTEQLVSVQSLPETVQFLRPPGNWTVPGAFLRQLYGNAAIHGPHFLAAHPGGRKAALQAFRPRAGDAVRATPSRVTKAAPERPWVNSASMPILSCMPPTPPPGAEKIIRWIMIGIVIWGIAHAIGAWTLNHDARRPLVVLACVAAFLGFWTVLLAARRRRLNNSPR
jgi:hypothetical protein